MGLNSNSKVPRRAKHTTRNSKVPTTIKISAKLKLDRFSQKGDDWVEMILPIVTVSEANGGVKKSYIINGKTCYKAEHWRDKHIRHKQQKGQVTITLNPLRHHLRMPCEISFTRFAPDKLDRFDNLPMSLKYILDAVCEIITQDFVPGRADSHEGLQVKYDQQQSQAYGVKIHIKNI